jgi:integrase
VWAVRYYLDGKQHLKTCRNKKEADAVRNQIGNEIDNRMHIAPSRSINVATACDRWLAAGEAAGLEPSTIDTYRAVVVKHIKPMIGDVLLAEMTPATVSEFGKMLTGHDGKCKDGEPSRSPVMISKTITLLSSILGEAQADGLVARNVASERSRKRRKHVAARLKPQPEIGRDIPTVDEMERILDAANPRWRTLLLVAAATGMRASELRGLHWENVDLDASLIHIRQRADKRNKMGAPKTEKSRRSISIGPQAVKALKEWKLQWQSRGGPLGLVFPSNADNGNRVMALSSIVRAGLLPTVMAAGLVGRDGTPKYTGMHAFRHFHASLCLNPVSRGGLGLSPQETQARLGHSSIVITMNVYGHLFPRGDDSKAMEAAEAALLG